MKSEIFPNLIKTIKNPRPPALGSFLWSFLWLPPIILCVFALSSCNLFFNLMPSHSSLEIFSINISNLPLRNFQADIELRFNYNSNEIISSMTSNIQLISNYQKLTLYPGMKSGQRYTGMEVMFTNGRGYLTNGNPFTLHGAMIFSTNFDLFYSTMYFESFISLYLDFTNDFDSNQIQYPSVASQSIYLNGSY